MSSDAVIRSGASAQGTTLSRTVVPEGITDPVEKARAELKAALAAIEQQANVPRRIGDAVDLKLHQARAFARRNPAAAVAIVAAKAVVVGGLVWAGVRAYAR